MSISCTFSHKKWGDILSLLRKAQTPNKTKVSNLKGVEKRHAKVNISIIGRSKTPRNDIPHIIRLISQECNKHPGACQVTILLDEQIWYLIQRLYRRYQIKTKRSASILTTPIM
jgi:hypothetical protein